MSRSLSSDFFVPQVAVDTAFSVFTYKLDLLQKALQGVAGSPIRVGDPGMLTVKGDRKVTPYFTRILNLVTKRDLTSESAPTDLKLAGSNKGSIVLRRKVGPVVISHDVFRTSGNSPALVSAELGRQGGQELYKALQSSIFAALRGVMQLTFDGTSHRYTTSYKAYGTATRSTEATAANTLTMGILNAGKNLMGDRRDELTTAVLRSGQANDMIRAQLGLGYDSIAGHAAVRGIPRTVGMGDPIVIDDAYNTQTNPNGSRAGSGSGTGTASNTAEYAYLMGEGCIEIDFPTPLEFWAEDRLDGEAPYTRMLGNFDFTLGFPGIGYKASSGANPTDATLATSTPWEDKTTGGHREVRIVQIKTNAGVA